MYIHEIMLGENAWLLNRTARYYRCRNDQSEGEHIMKSEADYNIEYATRNGQ